MTDIKPEPRIYRASGLGYSLCQLVCPHLGYEPLPTPDWLMEKFNQGKELEPVVVDKLRSAFGWEIKYQNVGAEDGRDGEKVTLEVIPGVASIEGHIDGRIKFYGDSREKVLEIKTMSDRNWQDFSTHGMNSKSALLTKYKWQISVYMLATGLPVMLVGWNKEADPDGNVDELITSRLITSPPCLLSDIALRIQTAEDYIRQGTIPEGCTDYPCPYVYLHGEKETPDPADNELDSLLDEWLAIDQQIKAFERDKAALRKVIVELQGEISGKVKGSQGVTVSTVWTPESEVKYTKKAAWVTTISGPRGRENA